MLPIAWRSYATLLLRLTLGVALLAHSLYLKVFVFSMDGTVRFFESLGLPGLLAWAVLLIEAAAGIALILGLRTRLATLAAFPLLLGGGAHALADDEAAS